MSREKINLGKRIKSGRIALDLSQHDFATRLKISDRTLSRYETGATIPDALTWIKIEHLLKNVFYMDNIVYAPPRLHKVEYLTYQIDSGIILKIYGKRYEYYVLLDRTGYVGEQEIYGKQILNNNSNNFNAIHINGRD